MKNDPKSGGLTPIRRVVTGNDARGHSKVVWDGPAPNAHEASMGTGRGHTDLWVWNEIPRSPFRGLRRREPRLRLPRAARGRAPARRAGARAAGELRPGQGQDVVPAHPPKLRAGRTRTWDRGGNNAYSSAMHKTETVDYGIVLAGERELILDDRKLVMKPGDIVIQVGAWHQWVMPKGAMMAFDMIAARFVDGPQGLAQGNDMPMRAAPKLPAGVKPSAQNRHHRPRAGTIHPGGRRPGARRAHRSGAAGLCLRAPVGHRRHAGEDRARNAAAAAHARAAGARLGLPRRDLPARRRLERQGRRARGAGVLPCHGLARRLHLLPARAAPLHAEDAHARFRHRARRARSCWCWTRRK